MDTKSKFSTDTATLGKKIDAWAKAGKKWVADGHPIAMSCLARLKEHGDIGYINRLYLAMPKGTKTSAMASWLLTYGSLVANTAADKKEKPFVFDKTKSTNLEAAEADPWYEHAVEKQPDEVFDLQKALLSMLKKANSATTVTHSNENAVKALRELAKACGVDESGITEKLAGTKAATV